MRILTLLCIAFLLSAAGCSSGSGSPGSTQVTPVTPGPTAKVRFVNAATRMGTVTFALGTTQVSVPAREASAEMTVPVTTTVITVTNGTAIGTQTFNFQESWDFDIVAIENPAGGLGLISIFGKEPNVDPATARLTYFNFGDAVAGQTDAYVVTPGTDITTVAPTFAGGGGTLSFAAGTYVLTITPIASKKILFQSVPFNLASGRNDVIIGAPATASDLTPKPFLVTWDEDAADLADSRPTVRMLKRLDAVPPLAMTISLDGDVVGQIEGPGANVNVTYHASPGVHYFSDAVHSESTIQIDSGNRYVQRYGFFFLGAVSSGDRWLQPDIANDYPGPADKARVHLIVENNDSLACDTNVVRVDGTPLPYPNQQWGNPSAAFDHAPGSLKLDVLKANGTTLLASRSIPLLADHYYFVRVYSVFYSEFPPDCQGPYFEISGDE